MIQTIANSSSLRWLTENARLLFQRPRREQIAALCHREGPEGPEVLLITSRSSKRWIIPKGWPMANLSARKTASVEAFEEAGIIGKAAKKPLGIFPSQKGIGNGFKVKTNLMVFPLRVEKQTKKFPEKGKRDLAWLPLEKAIERCEDAGVKAMLRSNEVKRLLTDRD